MRSVIGVRCTAIVDSKVLPIGPNYSRWCISSSYCCNQPTSCTRKPKGKRRTVTGCLKGIRKGPYLTLIITAVAICTGPLENNYYSGESQYSATDYLPWLLGLRFLLYWSEWGKLCMIFLSPVLNCFMKYCFIINLILNVLRVLVPRLLNPGFLGTNSLTVSRKIDGRTPQKAF